MVSKAHEKGLKVIMDVVTNHCGIDHWWMKDMPFKDWVNMHDEYVGTSHRFSVLTDPYGSQHDREIMSRGWFVPSMPDMNLDNPFVLSYFEQWAAWWIEYAGLDGLRVDTFFTILSVKSHKNNISFLANFNNIITKETSSVFANLI